MRQYLGAPAKLHDLVAGDNVDGAMPGWRPAMSVPVAVTPGGSNSIHRHRPRDPRNPTGVFRLVGSEVTDVYVNASRILVQAVAIA